MPRANLLLYLFATCLALAASLALGDDFAVACPAFGYVCVEPCDTAVPAAPRCWVQEREPPGAVSAHHYLLDVATGRFVGRRAAPAPYTIGASATMAPARDNDTHANSPVASTQSADIPPIDGDDVTSSPPAADSEEEEGEVHLCDPDAFARNSVHLDITCNIGNRVRFALSDDDVFSRLFDDDAGGPRHISHVTSAAVEFITLDTETWEIGRNVSALTCQFLHETPEEEVHRGVIHAWSEGSPARCFELTYQWSLAASVYGHLSLAPEQQAMLITPVEASTLSSTTVSRLPGTAVECAPGSLERARIDVARRAFAPSGEPALIDSCGVRYEQATAAGGHIRRRLNSPASRVVEFVEDYEVYVHPHSCGTRNVTIGTQFLVTDTRAPQIHGVLGRALGSRLTLPCTLDSGTTWNGLSRADAQSTGVGGLVLPEGSEPDASDACRDAYGEQVLPLDTTYSREYVEGDPREVTIKIESADEFDNVATGQMTLVYRDQRRVVSDDVTLCLWPPSFVPSGTYIAILQGLGDALSQLPSASLCPAHPASRLSVQLQDTCEYAGSDPRVAAQFASAPSGIHSACHVTASTTGAVLLKPVHGIPITTYRVQGQLVDMHGLPAEDQDGGLTGVVQTTIHIGATVTEAARQICTTAVRPHQIHYRLEPIPEETVPESEREPAVAGFKLPKVYYKVPHNVFYRYARMYNRSPHVISDTVVSGASGGARA